MINEDSQKPEIYISSEEIQQAAVRCADAVNHFLEDKSGGVVLVCVLKGAIFFFSDVLKHLSQIKDCELDVCRVKSYENDSSTGRIEVLLDCKAAVEGKHVVLFEDIVDTGLTLDFLRAHFEKRGVASLMVCTLLDKPSRRKVSVDVEFAAITVPDKFLVGYGLDYNQKYRLLNDICVLTNSQ